VVRRLSVAADTERMQAPWLTGGVHESANEAPAWPHHQSLAHNLLAKKGLAESMAVTSRLAGVAEARVQRPVARLQAWGPGLVGMTRLNAELSMVVDR